MELFSIFFSSSVGTYARVEQLYLPEQEGRVNCRRGGASGELCWTENVVCVVAKKTMLLSKESCFRVVHDMSVACTA